MILSTVLLSVSVTDYLMAFFQIGKSKNLLGSVMGIAAIPILGGIILAALKRAFDIRRKS
jgi:hypothetical protein